MMRPAPIVALVLTAACATSGPRAEWSALVGCWIDASDAVPPASMIWRADPARPGAFIGAWRAPEPDGFDAVDFHLAPDGERMRLCERGASSTSERCVSAYLSPALTDDLPDGSAIFAVDAETLEFGFTDGMAAFYVGRRGACA